MMKVVLAVGALLVLLLLIVLALPFLVDLNGYVGRYKPQIEDALQRKIELNDIRLSIWPRLGARVGGFAIMDDSQFGTAPFASFTSLDVGVKLWPLLSGHVEIEEIALRNPVITVIKGKDGRLNVSTIANKEATDREEAHAPAPSQASEAGPLRALALLAVDRVLLTNGRLTFRDFSTAPSATEYVLEHLEIRVADLRLGQTPTVHVGTVVQPINVPVTLDGLGGPLRESGEVERFDIQIGLGKTILSFNGSLIDGKATVDVTSPAIHSEDLPFELPLTKPVTVNNLRARVTSFFPPPPGAFSMESLEVHPLELEVAMGESRIAVTGMVGGHRAKVRITSSAVDSGDWPIPLPLAKPVVIKNLNVQAEASLPLKAGVPVFDQLDVLPSELAAVMGGSMVTVRGRASGGEVRIQAAAPVLRTGDLPVSIAALKKSVELNNLRATVQMNATEARLTDFTVQVFGGQVKAGAGSAPNVTPMPFDAKLAVEGLQLGPLMEALGISEITVSGTSKAHLSLRGRGYSMAELAQALEGTVQLTVKDGMVEGVDLGHEAMAVLKVVGLSPDAVKTTVFSTLETDLRIAQGVVTVQRLFLDSDDVQGRGQGTIGFDQALKLKAELALSHELSREAAAASSLAKLVSSGGRLTVPILIGGTVQAPTYALDATVLSGRVQEKLTGKLQEKVQEQADKLLKGKSGEAVKKGAEALKRLFGP